MSLIYRRPWTRQPQGTEKLSQAQSLARRFDVFANFNGPSGLTNAAGKPAQFTSTLTGGYPASN